MFPTDAFNNVVNIANERIVDLRRQGFVTSAEALAQVMRASAPIVTRALSPATPPVTASKDTSNA